MDSQLLFAAAEPVWPAGRDRDMNLAVGFRAPIELERATGPIRTRIAAAAVYRLFVNGAFVGCGPARSAHGWTRVDEWDITADLHEGLNWVAMEVFSYGVPCYGLADNPAFLRCEAVAPGSTGERVLAVTMPQERPVKDDVRVFEAFFPTERVRHVHRYSFQRGFAETYRLTPDSYSWRTGAEPVGKPAALDLAPALRLLRRGVPYPTFDRLEPCAVAGRGYITQAEPAPHIADGLRVHAAPAADWPVFGFPTETLQGPSVAELHALRTVEMDAAVPPQVGTSPLTPGAFCILDFGTNRTGFICAHLRCTADARVVFLFDEILTNGDVDFLRLACVNAVVLDLAPGEHIFETSEPYTLRYLKIIALAAPVDVEGVHLREYAGPHADPLPEHPLPGLTCVDAAAIETLRQNALDILMDCPSRERAGWLCDSFFTARAAHAVWGNTQVERNFLENYLLPAGFGPLPTGMLPMCYPADHRNGVFIPNWALWFILQLEEYGARSGDTAMLAAFAPRVAALLAHFEEFRNPAGLLENLPSWVFVEWSAANDWVAGVNYPSNALYAGALDAAGRLYERPDWRAEAARLRSAIATESYDGEFLVDQAVRMAGALQRTDHVSEAGQYYAFYFDVATPASHPALWARLVQEFGPNRQPGAYPAVHPARPFIGYFLRLELLSRHGLHRQVLDEALAYFLPMAERTGTLWEHADERASCNHGFASHLAYVLRRELAALGAPATQGFAIR